MFCSECGAQNPDTNRFCTSCGKALAKAVTPPLAQVLSHQETILALVPYTEQGTVFTGAFLLVITSSRLIATPVPHPLTTAFAAKEDEIEDEWVELPTLAEQRSYLSRRDWQPGPWQQFYGMTPDAIAAGAKPDLIFPFSSMQGVIIVADREIGLEDTIIIVTPEEEVEFSMKFAAGDRIAPLLEGILGKRFVLYTRKEWEIMHRKHSFGHRYTTPF